MSLEEELLHNKAEYFAALNTFENSFYLLVLKLQKEENNSEVTCEHCRINVCKNMSYLPAICEECLDKISHIEASEFEQEVKSHRIELFKQLKEIELSSIQREIPKYVDQINKEMNKVMKLSVAAGRVRNHLVDVTEKQDEGNFRDREFQGTVKKLLELKTIEALCRAFSFSKEATEKIVQTQIETVFGPRVVNKAIRDKR